MYPKSQLVLSVLLLIVMSCKIDDPTWPKSAERAILKFSFDSLSDASVVINEANRTISITVGYVDITNLKASIQVSKESRISPSDTIAQDFSKPVVYTVKSENGLTRDYTVLVSKEYNELILGGNSDGYLYAYLAQTGKLKWKFKAGAAISGTVTVAGNLAIVGSDDHNLYAIDISTGTKKWSFAMTSGSTNSAPLVAGGVVYVADGSGIYAIELSAGKLKWKTDGTVAYGTSPVIIDSMVYVGGSGKQLSAFSLTQGKERWAFSTQSAIVSSPTVNGKILYMGVSGSDSIGFYAINATTKETRWTTTSKQNINQITSCPTLSNGILYLGSENKNLYGLDAADGQTKWVYSSDHPLKSSPIVNDSLLYINMNSGLTALRLPLGGKADPSVKWVFNDDGKAIGKLAGNSPVFANKMIYTTGNSGYILAIDAITGKSSVKFEHRDGGNFSNPCVVTLQGQVFQSGVSGAVH